jgi:membrane protease YdiL (CAAX protease family)
LSLGQALLAVLAAFILAQLFGKLASDMAGAIGGPMPAPAAGPAAPSAQLSARVVVPSMLASEFALLLVSIVVPLLRSLSVRDALGLYPNKPLVFLAAAVGTVMLGPLGDTLMSAFSAQFPTLTLGVVPTLHELASRLPLLALWPTFALLPGIAEELLFRGVLQRALGRTILAVVVSGVAFACFHVDPVHVVGVLPLGVFLSWVAYRSSTLVTIFAHVVNNSIAVFSIQSSVMDVGYGTPNALPLSWLVASLALFAASAVLIARSTNVPRPMTAP